MVVLLATQQYNVLVVLLATQQYNALVVYLLSNERCKMKDDLKLIRAKIRAANKLPADNPVDYNLKQDILRHWKLEQYMLKRAIMQDQFEPQ